MAITAIDHDQQWLDVHFSDGTTSRFLGSWLRDNVGSGRHRSEGQRTFDINTLPPVSITNAHHTNGAVTVSFSPEGLVESFDEEWIRRQRGGDRDRPAGVVPQPKLWDAQLQSKIGFEDYPSLANNSARLHDWLTHIHDYGFGLLENVSTTPGSILDVVALFGYTRETNYGRLFDVRVEADPANLAFTRLGIGMHTDNPYRDPVPGLQLLHCLVNESDGGANQLCDGFAVAEKIRAEHPDAFDLLSTRPVRFRFLEEGSADLQLCVPLIEVDSTGDVKGIRYNSRSAQAFEMPTTVLSDYYDAYRILGESLHDPGALIEFRLEPGQLVVFANQRVLHGRSSYDEGDRHLQGCYADKDSLHSRIRTLEAQR